MASRRHYTLFIPPPVEVAPTRQRTWVPRRLIEITAPSGIRLIATEDIDDLATPYEGRLLESPHVKRRMRDDTWGQIDVEDVSFSIANADFYLPADSPETLRMSPVVTKRYDRRSDELLVEWSGVVAEAALVAGVLSVRATNLDTSVLETLVPTRLVDTATWPKCVPEYLAKPVQVVVGSVPKMPLWYVHEDFLTNTYHYLVGHGSILATTAFRDGVATDDYYPMGFTEFKNASGNPATSWADAMRTDLYSGFTVMVPALAQLNFSNGRHRLFADVTGLSAEQNFATCIKTVLTDTAWGCGKTANAASFATAAAALDTVGNLFADFALVEQIAAGDLLSALMMPRGMRLGTEPGTTDWTLEVDTAQTDATLNLYDGPEDGERNLVSCGPRTAPSIDDAVKRVELKYREDMATAEPIHMVYRDLQDVGKVLTLVNQTIRNTVTADMTVHFVGLRLFVGQTQVGISLPQEARALDIGDLVDLTYTPLGFASTRMEVAAIDKMLELIQADLRAWSVVPYVYGTGDLPDDEVLGTVEDYSRTPPSPVTNVSMPTTAVEQSQDGIWTAKPTLEYDTPAENISHVLIEYRKNGTTVYSIAGTATGTGVNVQATVPGLVTNQAYDFQLTVINAFGLPSTAVTLSNQTMPTDTTGPATPTGLTASIGTGSVISLDWNDNVEPDLDEYFVFRNTVDSGWPVSPFTDTTLLIAKVKASRFVDVNVVQSTPYFYKLIAEDLSTNKSPALTAVVSETPTGAAQGTAPLTPSAPTLNTSGVAQGSDGKTWAFVVVNNPSMPTGGALLNILARAQGATNWTVVAQLSAGGSTTRIDGGVPGMPYEIAAQAFNAFGAGSAVSSVLSHTATGDTTAPADAGTPSIVSQSMKQAQLQWTASTSKDVREYNWDLRTAASGGGSLIASSKVEGTSKSVTSDVYGTRHFRVQPVDFTGNVGNWTASRSITFIEAQTVDYGTGSVTSGPIGPLAVTTSKRQDFIAPTTSVSHTATPGIQFTTHSVIHNLGRKMTVIPSLTGVSGESSTDMFVGVFLAANDANSFTVRVVSTNPNVTISATLTLEYW